MPQLRVQDPLVCESADSCRAGADLVSNYLRVVVLGDPAVVLDVAGVERDFFNEDEPAFVLLSQHLG